MAAKGRRYCLGCHHFAVTLDGAPTGQCRRNPPVVVADTPHPKAFWPPVHAVDWCGEWKMQPSETTPPVQPQPLPAP